MFNDLLISRLMCADDVFLRSLTRKDTKKITMIVIQAASRAVLPLLKPSFHIIDQEEIVPLIPIINFETTNKSPSPQLLIVPPQPSVTIRLEASPLRDYREWRNERVSMVVYIHSHPYYMWYGHV